MIETRNFINAYTYVSVYTRCPAGFRALLRRLSFNKANRILVFLFSFSLNTVMIHVLRSTKIKIMRMQSGVSYIKKQKNHRIRLVSDASAQKYVAVYTVSWYTSYTRAIYYRRRTTNNNISRQTKPLAQTAPARARFSTFPFFLPRLARATAGGRKSARLTAP